MELTSKKFIRSLLKKNEIGARENGRVVGGWRPSKGLGQNFLVSKEILKKIIKAAELKSSDIVLEIGPGIGTLTYELAKRVKKVIAIEKDPNLVRILNNELRIMEIKNVKIIQDDILKIHNSKFMIHNSYKVVANLPYYITSPVIRKFLETENKPKLMVLMVQKEVSQRICPPARAGAKRKMNLLAVSVQFYSKPEIISFVSKKSFWPSPKVDSAILQIAPLINADKKLINADLFFKVVKAGFSQPRKQLLNNFSKGKFKNFTREKIKNWLLVNGIKPEQRAENLNLKDWLNLTRSLPLDI